MGNYSMAVQSLFEELATDEMSHVMGIQAYLGMFLQHSCAMNCLPVVTCADDSACCDMC